MKIVTVIGARPQFIKAAPVCRSLRRQQGVRELLVHTGQHYDANMSALFFEEMEIPRPDFALQIGSGSHGQQTGRMLEAIEQVLLQERPDQVLVYGDTNSTMAGALAAVKLHIPVAHVEAGLRSFNCRMPEEINRILTDHVADRLFTPTETASSHLRREGIAESRIHLTGDVMFDAALYYGDKAERQSTILERLALTNRGYVLATIHRAENTDHPERLQAILGGLAQVHRELPVILPLHPRTRHTLVALGLDQEVGDGIRLIDPVGYLDMVMLEQHARLIATDSGGVQKEAFFYEVPCVTLRDETEWTELVALGWNHLHTPIAAEAVASFILDRLDRRGQPAQPFGNGQAAPRIAQLLVS